MRNKTNKFLASALSCSIVSAMLGGTAAYAADTQTGSPGTVAEQQLTADADMSKYFGEWVLYQLDSKPVTSDQDAIKFSIKDDHSFKIDGEDYKWEVYEDGVRMQVLSMDDRGYGLIDIVGDTLVHDLADSKWYYKRVDADNSTTTEITTENSTDTGIVTTENTTDTEIVTTENATDPEITTEIVTENATEETTLPETGMSGSHKVFAGISALMGITGIGLVKKSRKEDEE